MSGTQEALTISSEAGVPKVGEFPMFCEVTVQHYRVSQGISGFCASGKGQGGEQKSIFGDSKVYGIFSEILQLDESQEANGITVFQEMSTPAPVDKRLVRKRTKQDLCLLFSSCCLIPPICDFIFQALTCMITYTQVFGVYHINLRIP